jgi:aspartate racemase
MKTLGIIGGIGPESTIEYYRTIVALYRERKQDGSYPQLVINSIDLKKGMDLLAAGDLAGEATHLLDEIQKLARAGADFGLIAANTSHIIFDDIAPKAAIPLISIVEVTCRKTIERGLKRLGLFGTRFTMQAEFYPKVFAREGIELVTPKSADQEYIHSKYMNELVAGKFLPETRASLLGIVDRLEQEKNIDGVILAGTELPLILRDPAYHGIPLLDTMKIHAEAAVAEMLS